MDKANTTKLEERIRQLEQKNNQLQKSLRESEKRERITLNSIGDAVISTDKQGTIVQVNAVAQNLTGWDAEDAKGKAFNEVFNIFDALTGEKAANPINKVLKKGTVEGLANHTKLIAKNGAEYQIADSASPIKDNQGYIYGVVVVFRDVTEEYKKNQQLKENREFLETTFQSIQDGISVLNTDLSIRYVNHVMENWYAENKPLVGRKCYKAYHHSSVPCNPCPSLRCMETKKTESAIVPGSPHPNSPVKWLELYSYPIMDSESGEVKGVVEFVRDITQRIKDSNQLIAQKERLANIIEGTDAGTWEWNVQTDETRFNERWAQFIGYTLKELAPTTIDTWMKFTHPEDLKKCREELDKHFRGETNLYECEHRMKHKGGNWIWVLDRGKVVSWTNDGKPLRMFGTHQDITKRKKTELKLQESEHKYRQLFENAPVGISQTNLQGDPLMQNEAMAHLLGFESSEEIMKFYYEQGKSFYLDNERRQEFLQKLKEQKSVKDFEYRMKRKDGKPVWLSVTANLIDYGNNSGAVVEGFAIDITDRKEAEFYLQKSYEELETTEEELKSSNEELQQANQTLEEQKEELIKAKEQAEKSKKTAENYLNIAAEIILVLDLEGNITRLNDSGHRLLGYEKGELIGKNWIATCIPNDYQNSVRQIFNKAAQGDFQEIKLAENPVITKTGERKTILWHNSYLKDKKNKITGILTSGEDITERKEAQRQLKKNENFISALINNLNVGVVACNAEGILTYFNKKTEEFHGLPRKNLPADEWADYYDLYTKDGKTKLEIGQIPLYRALRGEYFTEIETVIKTKEGNALSILNSGQPLKDNQGNITGAVVAMHDITDRKLAEKQLIELNQQLTQQNEEIASQNEEYESLNEELNEKNLALQKSNAELEKAKERAEESDRLKSAFLANMSHEIRSPMNGIMGFSKILQDKDYPEDKQKKFLHIIHSRTKHLLHIINDLVDVSKIEANQLTLEFQHFLLNEVMQELYSVFSNELANRGKDHIQLKVHLELNYEESYIKTDFSRFRQIMDNLIGNAIKFTSEGTIEFGYEMHAEKTLLFYVKDSGKGIPGDQQEHIFERFRQADDPASRTHEGTGLGLTISKNLVELLGGKMWMRSKEGKGSVFYFTLPYENNSSKQNREEKETAQDIHHKEGKTVLLIEDDPASIEYMKELLEPYGLNLITCKTGREGYETFINNPDIELILMDIKLPDANGLEITRKIRSANTDVPIIAQTAYAMSHDAQKSMDAGCNDYISKPVDGKELLQKIGKFI